MEINYKKSVKNSSGAFETSVSTSLPPPCYFHQWRNIGASDETILSVTDNRLGLETGQSKFLEPDTIITSSKTGLGFTSSGIWQKLYSVKFQYNHSPVSALHLLLLFEYIYFNLNC
jgi:hypothetical protein